MENTESRTVDRQEEIYRNAENLIEGKLFAEAAAEFARIADYKDASERKLECDRLAEDRRKDEIYAEADRAADNPNVRSQEKAIRIFSSIPGWRDADERIETAKRRIEEIIEKERADREEARRAAEAKQQKAKKRKKRIIRLAVITGVVAVVCAAGVFLFKKYAVPQITYQRAVALMEEGKPDEAYRMLHDLNCRDSNELVQSIAQNRLENAEVGSTVRFGSYPKGHITSKKKDDIEWLVLDKDGDKLLLITKQVIDCLPFLRYDQEDMLVTWENSLLRSWLNSEFMDIAFDKGEQALLIRTHVKADGDVYDSSVDPDTLDKVFVLSAQEVQQVFPDPEDRKCLATQYALEFGAYQSSIGKSCIWWLRTPRGHYISETLDDEVVPVSFRVACIGTSGEIIEVGHNVTNRGYGVRPSVWVTVNPSALQKP